MKLILFISIVFLLIVGYTSKDLFREGGKSRKQEAIVQEDISKLKGKISEVVKYRDIEPEELDGMYRDFFNNVKLISSFNNTFSSFFIPGLKDYTSVEELFEESCFLGVRMVELEVGFKTPVLENLVSPLSALDDIQRAQPVVIKRVNFEKDFLEFSIDIYGL